jgi:hypothetical protein
MRRSRTSSAQIDAGLGKARISPLPVYGERVREGWGDLLQCCSLLECSENGFDDTVNGFEHFSICKTDDATPLIRQIGGASFVALNFSLRSVCRSIKFDNKLPFAANEVAEIRPKRCLPNKFEALQLAPAQATPQPLLSRCLFVP